MLKVLVVEDEEMIRKGIVLAVDWAALDCVVVGEAADGLQALKAVERYDPSLIITDLKMPNMDGIQMMEALRARGSRAYVIILTAYDSFTYARERLRLGAVDFLLKPFHDGELEAAVIKLRRRRRRKGAGPPPPAGAEEGGQEQVCPPGDGLHRPALRGPEHLCGGDRPVPGAEREPFEPPVP